MTCDSAKCRGIVRKDSLLVVRYAHDRTTTYTYDKNNRVVQIDHPTGLGSEYFAYDGMGNLIAKRDGENAVTAYEYDGLNRLVAVKYGYGSNAWPAVITGSLSNPDVTYAYDGGSRLRTSMTDSTGTSSYVYDERDRLTSYTPPAPSGHGAISYAYNALGQKSSITNGSLAVNYDYYANGWLKRVVKDSAPIAEYTYDEGGNRTNVALGNGASTGYVYDTDPRYRIDTITHNVSGSPSTYAIGYTRDGAGNPLTVGTATYTYDNNSRLMSEGSTSFGYDWVGNRNPATWGYNVDDQLTATPNNQYTYLITGSLLEQYNGAGTVLQKEYVYTYTNLLSSVTHDDVSGVPTSAMTWDADGNRVAFTSSQGGTTKFVYDTTAGIPAVIEEVLPSTSSVYYVREPNGALIARIAGANTSYYHFDALGSTRLLTNASGAVTDTYSYDAWGNTTHDTGSLVQPYQYVGQLGYYTHYQDENLPMLQLGVRFYDPAVGRFTQVDPLGVDNSLYAYADDMPTMAHDADGMCWKIGCSKGPIGHRKCKSCIGKACHGDSECPLDPRPKKPGSPKPNVWICRIKFACKCGGEAIKTVIMPDGGLSDLVNPGVGAGATSGAAQMIDCFRAADSDLELNDLDEDKMNESAQVQQGCKDFANRQPDE